MKTNELDYFPAWTNGREGYASRVREAFEKIIDEEGLFKTPQRYHILDVLLRANQHLRAEEIYRTVKSKGVGRVTVFRTLKLLEKKRLISKVTGRDDGTRYELALDRPHHDHLVCIRCGHITEIQWPQAEKIQEKEAHRVGFKPLYHRNELFGCCRGCQKKGC